MKYISSAVLRESNKKIVLPVREGSKSVDEAQRKLISPL